MKKSLRGLSEQELEMVSGGANIDLGNILEKIEDALGIDLDDLDLEDLLANLLNN